MSTKTRKNRGRLIELLFPRTRRDILATTLLHPDKWWYLSDLARALNAVPQALRRDLQLLVAAGILQQRADGNRVYFKPAPDCPILQELQSIFVKTAGLVDVLHEALKPCAKEIQTAFVHGSIARGEELASSDIDLMIVGDVALSDIASSLKKAENRLSRPVNPTVYTQSEYSVKFRQGHNFIRTVHTAEKLFVMGTEDDLESIVSAEPPTAT